MLLKIRQILLKKRFYYSLNALLWFLATQISILIRFDGTFIFLGYFSTASFVFVCFLLNSFLIFLLQKTSLKSITKLIKYLVTLSFANFFTILLLLVLKSLFKFPEFPRSVLVLASLITLLFQISFGVIQIELTPNNEFQNFKSEKVIIYGAGKIGQQITEQLIDYPEAYTIIGFLDDNSKKLGSTIFGKKVIGTVNDFGWVIETFHPDVLIVAIYDYDIEKLKYVQKLCSNENIKIRLIANENPIFNGFVHLKDMRSIEDLNLLEREQLLSVSPEVKKLLRESCVLITGAGGSIGSEIFKQLSRYDTKKIFLLDRDENGLLRTKLEFDSKSDLTDSNVILADVRDYENLLEIMKNIKPDIVFHAAALKHVSSLERFPKEALKTNFEGTRNVWRSALNSSVKYFVNISTDKAADPETELGKSKLLSERIVASTPSLDFVNKYVSVRFGNVIGSNGSFVEIFRRQIEKGGPVTVRDEMATRYLMTVREAVNLVLEALIVGENGETLILDMGKPRKILDVANQMIQASGKNIEILFTGLRPGEKMHESLYSSQEKITVKGHPKIMHTNVEPLVYGDFNVL